MSYRETEIKLPLSDLTTSLAAIRSLGAKLSKPRHFEDNFLFDTETHYLRKNRMLLRLRTIKATENDKSPTRGILTFKGESRISDGVKDREEIETEIPSPDQLIRILTRIGFSITFRYQKYRTVYEIDGVPLEICVDETPIGNFLELEGEINSIHDYATRMGFSRDQYITDSYASLYIRWCHENKREPAHMIFS